MEIKIYCGRKKVQESQLSYSLLHLFNIILFCRGLNASARQDLDDYSDPTETSDKDDDSTADEEDLLHTRIKRRSGRSPNTSQIGLNADVSIFPLEMFALFALSSSSLYMKFVN